MPNQQDVVMFGAHYAKQVVNSYLEYDIPSRLTRYRNAWNVDDYTLPDPQKYLVYEPIALDHWPTIITVVISTNSFDRLMNYGGGDPLYRVSYSMRTYIWAKTEGAEEVTLMRDRLSTVVRSSLLDSPCMKGITEPVADIMLDESTMREEFSDLTLIKGDRVLAGAYVGYDLYLNELVYRQPVADISAIQTEVINLRGL
jgi:hypothetical protein